MAVYGVDIGTSSCKACCFDGKSCSIVTLTDGFNSFWGNDKLMVSAAYLDGDNNDELLIGQEAYNNHLLKPQWYLQEFKRKFSHKEPVLFTQDAQITIDEIYVETLNYLNGIFIKSGTAVDRLVLTHPASYSEALVSRMVSDARQAGFNDIEAIDEPSAAAAGYAFAHTVSKGENILVYDFGGGTFDTALIHVEDNGFRHLTGSLGLPDCGGADIDYLILADIKKKILADPSLDGEKSLRIPNILSILAEKAVSVKHKLSVQQKASETIMIGYTPFCYRLGRDELEAMAAPLIGRTMELCRKIVDNADLQAKNVNRVLLVGGSSRIPLISECLKKQFPAADICDNEDIEFLVCSGAAVSFGSSEEEMLLLKAKHGDAEAMFEMAGNYLNDKGGEKDNQKGMYWLRSSAEKGYVPACAELGIVLFQGAFDQQADREAALPWLQRAAEAGNDDAQDYLGDYYAGNGQPELAAVWYEKASEQGNVYSQFSLGAICIKTGQYRRGISLLERAAGQEHPGAQYFLGLCYEYGTDEISPDAGKAFEYYLRAADNGDTAAQLEVGKRYYFGREPVKEDNSQAFAWFSRAVEGHDAEAVYLLGECFEHGFGTTENINLAHKYYCEAADGGDMDAKAKLAAWHYYGRPPVVAVDYERAFELSGSALEESGVAAYIRALCYDNGNGVTQSRAKAVEYYEKAAEAGITGAVNDLAYIYFQGTHNVQKNYERAFVLAEKAAAVGVVDSMTLLGKCYDDGLGVPGDKEKALEWYRKAAEAGDFRAMRLIGIIYYNGEGDVGEDKALAEQWFRKAAANGDEESVEIIRKYFAPKPALPNPKIQFRRNKAFGGSARVHYVRIDLSNSSVRPLRNGTAFDYILTPGTHRVEVTNGPAFGVGEIDWSKSMCMIDESIEFEPGDILLIDTTINNGKVSWLQKNGIEQ